MGRPRRCPSQCVNFGTERRRTRLCESRTSLTVRIATASELLIVAPSGLCAVTALLQRQGAPRADRGRCQIPEIRNWGSGRFADDAPWRRGASSARYVF